MAYGRRARPHAGSRFHLAFLVKGIGSCNGESDGCQVNTASARQCQAVPGAIGRANLLVRGLLEEPPGSWKCLNAWPARLSAWCTFVGCKQWEWRSLALEGVGGRWLAFLGVQCSCGGAARRRSCPRRRLATVATGGAPTVQLAVGLAQVFAAISLIQSDLGEKDSREIDWKQTRVV